MRLISWRLVGGIVKNQVLGDGKGGVAVHFTLVGGQVLI